MSRVFVSIAVSLDGFMAPEWSSDEQFMGQWMQLQDYVIHQRSFRRRLHLGDDGETGVDDGILEDTFSRTGVTIMGKRMLDAEVSGGTGCMVLPARVAGVRRAAGVW